MDYHTLVDRNLYPNLYMHLEHGVLPTQIADIRCLLRLPQKRLPAGCSYTVASSLLNLVSGVSICLFNASIEKFNNNRRRGQAFTGLLSQYYPWGEESSDIPKQRAIKALYDSLRNPITHSLGLYKSNDRDRLCIVKDKLTSNRIIKLENPLVRPKLLPPTIDNPSTQIQMLGFHLVLSIPSLYWGFNRMLYVLLGDDSQSRQTEKFLCDLSSEYSKRVV
jgi:hypothetical protein